MTDYDPLTAYLLFGQKASKHVQQVAADRLEQSLHQRIAQETLSLSNRRAWTAIREALVASGIPNQDAATHREGVWEERKRVRRQRRCDVEIT